MTDRRQEESTLRLAQNLTGDKGIETCLRRTIQTLEEIMKINVKEIIIFTCSTPAACLQKESRVFDLILLQCI